LYFKIYIYFNNSVLIITFIILPYSLLHTLYHSKIFSVFLCVLFLYQLDAFQYYLLSITVFFFPSSPTLL
jgi:hypothetical protein